jgi:hypothetical protein
MIHHGDAQLAKYFTVLVQSWQLILKQFYEVKGLIAFKEQKPTMQAEFYFAGVFSFPILFVVFEGERVKSKQCFETERSNLDGILKSFNAMNVCERVEERQHFLQQTSQARIYLYLSPKIIHYMYNETLIY